MGGSVAATFSETATVSLLCRHCGLPSHYNFCCIGCELLWQFNTADKTQQERLENSLTLSLILSMIVMMGSLFLYAHDIYPIADNDPLTWLRFPVAWLTGLLSLPVLFLCGTPLLRRGLDDLHTRRWSLSLWIYLGAVAAYSLSIFNLLHGDVHIFFDSACSALLLATVGQGLLARTRREVTQLLQASVARLPTMATVVGPNGPQQKRVALLEIGDHIEITPDQSVPADIEVCNRVALADTAFLTGESAPQQFSPGALMPSGAIVVGQTVHGHVLRNAKDSALEVLLRHAQSLQQKPAATMLTAERLSHWLFPAIFITAIGTMAFWFVVGAPERGVMAALSVLLVACPCTFGAIAPLIFWLALRRAMAQGVMIRSPAVLEKLSEVDAIAFDKTGTLTKPTVHWHAIAPPETKATCAALLRTLEHGCQHPIAQALLALVGPGEVATLQNIRDEVGWGRTGYDDQGRQFSVGRTSGTDGHVILTQDQNELARFVVSEELRAEAKDTIATLKREQKNLAIVSGDANERVHKISDELGLQAIARQTPAEKSQTLKTLGHHTAMVGDGLNDTLAFASSGLSFAFGEGSNLAQSQAHVILTRADLRLVPWTLRLAQNTRHVARRALLWSVCYNVVFVGLAAMGTLKPIFAGISMLISSLIALWFALSVGNFHPGAHE